MFEKIKNWFLKKMNEFILFLEYPMDYIVEFGDELKTLDTSGKVIKIGKLLISAYLCVQIVMFLLFAVIVIVLFGSGAPAGGDAYTRALEQQLADAPEGSREAADIRQELHNMGADK